MHIEGEHISLPSKYVFFGDIDYFTLVIFKKEKTQKEPLTFCLAA